MANGKKYTGVIWYGRLSFYGPSLKIAKGEP